MCYIFIAVYLILAPLTYAMAFAEAQALFPSIAVQNYRSDMGWSIYFALFSPVSTLIIFLSSGFAQHGLKWK